MNSQEQYDLIVIGGGAGGSACTQMVVDAGYRVAQIERDHLGGTCLNYGCDPTKTLLHIGQQLQQAVRAERYGFPRERRSVDWAAVRQRVDEVQTAMRGGKPEEARQQMRSEGIDLVMGEAAFVSPHEIEVKGRRLYAQRFLIATGQEPLIPAIPGLRDTGFLTNREALYLPELPARLAVIGGGPLGTEFAQLFHRLDVAVSLFDAGDQILPKDDPELASALAQCLSDEGIDIRTGRRLKAVQPSSAGKELLFGHGANEERFHCDELLLALGRRPALQALQLQVAGVATNKEGIVVDATLRTSVPHIWAAGDIATDYPFTHTAVAQSQYLAEAIFAEDPPPFDNRAIPWVTYTDPALAHVGQTEQELQEAGVEYRVAQAHFGDIPRAQITGETAGQVKLLVGNDGHLLGGHILASGAGDLIAPIVLAMRNDLPISALQSVVLPYPTMVQALRQAARSLL